MTTRLADAQTGSTYVLTLDFTDSHGELITPTSVSYTLRDAASAIVNSKSDVSVPTTYIRLDGADLPPTTLHLTVKMLYDSATYGSNMSLTRDYTIKVNSQDIAATSLFTQDSLIAAMSSQSAVDISQYTTEQLVDLARQAESQLESLTGISLAPTRYVSARFDTTGETLRVITERPYAFDGNRSGYYAFKLRKAPVSEINKISLEINNNLIDIPSSWIKNTEAGLVQIAPTTTSSLLSVWQTHNTFALLHADYVTSLSDDQLSTARRLVLLLIQHNLFITSAAGISASVSVSIDGVSESTSNASMTALYDSIVSQAKVFARSIGGIGMAVA